MKKSGLEQTTRKSQYNQTERIPGSQVGQVVDVRDPWRMGRIRIHVHGMNGDYPLTDISDLDWAAPSWAGRGSFSPPQLGDRALVTFEAGDKYAPMYTGQVYETPMGHGTLPWNKRNGTEVPSCGWHNRDLYPESNVLACSGNGNSVYLDDILLGSNNDGKGDLISSANIADSSSKYIRVQSQHLSQQTWSPVDLFPDGKGALYQADFGENKEVRSGFELLPAQVAGNIEMAVCHLWHELGCSSTNDSFDITVQGPDQSSITHERQAISGKLYELRQEEAVLTMMKDTVYLSGTVIASNFLSPPSSW